jgi:hypothetical protein
MDVDQKEKIADLLHMGVKPARIHQELVTENPEKTPSMLQLNNLSYQESMKDIPCGMCTYAHAHPYFSYYLLFILNITNVGLLQGMQFITFKQSTWISCKKLR